MARIAADKREKVLAHVNPHTTAEVDRAIAANAAAAAAEADRTIAAVVAAVPKKRRRVVAPSVLAGSSTDAPPQQPRPQP